MAEARTTMRTQGGRWPRLLGAILLAAGLQAGLGAWAVWGGAVAAYLAGVAVVTCVSGILLLAVPLAPHAAEVPAKKAK